jgi:hypothetical protein
MPAISYQRGQQLTYQGGAWRYVDDGALVTEVRPCVRCGRMPTEDGHDACLGRIPGIVSACCGHGIEAPYKTPGTRLYCHQLGEYGYHMSSCCACCHGLTKASSLMEYEMKDGNTAVVCGGAAKFLEDNGCLVPGQSIGHGCDWRGDQ